MFIKSLSAVMCKVNIFLGSAKPILVAARCGSRLAGIAGSNPAGGVDV
jgi:hypothetical protein